MDGFGIFLGKELREAARMHRLLVVGILFLLLGIISPVTAKYTNELLKLVGSGQQGVQILLPPPSVKDAVAQYLKNVAGTGLLVAVLLPMGMIAREKERGTAAFALTKPLARSAFLLAKFVALVLTLTVGVVLAALATYFYTALLFEPLPLGGFVGCTVLVLLSLLVYATCTFLGSALVSSQLAAAGIGLGAWVGLSLVGIIPQVVQYTPAGLLEPASALALGTAAPHLAVSTLANLILIVALVALAWLSFHRQELIPAG